MAAAEKDALASVRFGQVDEIVTGRQQVLDEAYPMNSTRFPNGRPIVRSNPEGVGINRHLKSLAVENGVGGEFQSEEVWECTATLTPDTLFR